MSRRLFIPTVIIGIVLLTASLMFSHKVDGSGCVSEPAGPLTELSYSGSAVRGFPIGFLESGTSDVYCHDFISLKAVALIIDLIVWLAMGFGVVFFYDRNKTAGKQKNG